MAGRLNAGSLAGLPPQVGRPDYPLGPVTVGAVHLGVGNFFRAHQAAYLDAAMNLGACEWGVCGVSLRSPATRDALLAQDGLYTLIERGSEGDRARVIGSLREMLVAKDDPAPVIARLAAPATRLVSLTITEKGYGHAGGSHLDLDDPAIARDIAWPGSPCSAVGLLHAAVLRRRIENAGPMTILSCDNLSGNGDLVRTLLLEFDSVIGAGASSWIEDQLAFPNTMVDRIVPHTTDRERSLARQLLGVEDAWPVATESFSQWVIEDRFAAARPPLEEVGVQLVADVQPFEAMKLRLLNAAHSAIAWLGFPAGLQTVDRAIAQPDVRRFIEELWRLEIIPGLPVEVRGAAPTYCAGLLARFANPALAHRTAQIAMDGSQKLPLRVLPSIRSNLGRGLPTGRLALVIAAWLNYLRGTDETGMPFEPSDPLRDSLREAAGAVDSRAAARLLFERTPIFGDLAGHEALAEAVSQWLERLRRDGALATLSSIRTA